MTISKFMTILIMAQLTIQEAQRRRILWLSLLMALSFLAVFGIGLHYIMAELERINMDAAQMQTATGLLLTAGLYVVNFLIIIMSVLTSVTAVSGEIDSHTIETIITKPVRRSEVILGKWLGFVLLLLFYVMMLSGGMMLIFTLRTGFKVENVLSGMGLMMLQGLTLLSVTLWGGTRLSTLANGVLAFMLYGIAFIGGWVEQIGSIFQNETAVNIGIITSLIMPTEIVWKKALTLFQPDVISSFAVAGPLSVASQPSDLMMHYAVVYTAVLLLLALISFSRLDL